MVTVVTVQTVGTVRTVVIVLTVVNEVTVSVQQFKSNNWQLPVTLVTKVSKCQKA